MDVKEIIDTNVKLLSTDADVYRYREDGDTIYRVFADIHGEMYAIEVVIADRDSESSVYDEIEKIFEEHDVEKLS